MSKDSVTRPARRFLRVCYCCAAPVPDMWISFLSDPDGVPFELVERPRAAFRS